MTNFTKVEHERKKILPIGLSWKSAAEKGGGGERNCGLTEPIFNEALAENCNVDRLHLTSWYFKCFL